MIIEKYANTINQSMIQRSRHFSKGENLKNPKSAGASAFLFSNIILKSNNKVIRNLPKVSFSPTCL
jgi:hypothetical protein